MARRYGKTGKTKEAAAAYDAAAKADPPKAAMYYFNEAATLFNANDMDGAAAAADKAIAADPTKVEAYYIKGQALVQKATVRSGDQQDHRSSGIACGLPEVSGTGPDRSACRGYEGHSAGIGRDGDRQLQGAARQEEVDVG